MQHVSSHRWENAVTLRSREFPLWSRQMVHSFITLINVFIFHQEGKTPIHYAVANELNAVEICRLLLEHKSDPSIKDKVWIIEQCYLYIFFVPKLDHPFFLMENDESSIYFIYLYWRNLFIFTISIQSQTQKCWPKLTKLTKVGGSGSLIVKE